MLRTRFSRYRFLHRFHRACYTHTSYTNCVVYLQWYVQIDLVLFLTCVSTSLQYRHNVNESHIIPVSASLTIPSIRWNQSLINFPCRNIVTRDQRCDPWYTASEQENRKWNMFCTICEPCNYSFQGDWNDRYVILGSRAAERKPQECEWRQISYSKKIWYNHFKCQC